MKKGWCVVDGGATRTLGSLVAVQNVIDRNTAETGDTKILKVDTERKPIFSFGNSSENQCMSTIELGVQAGVKEGKLTVHTLDAGSGPILLSVTPSALNMSLDRQNKASLQELLRARGEDPPRGWTKIELRQRLLELDPALGEAKAKEVHRTELQEWVCRINKARSKKAQLVELCTKELELNITGNETIPTLERWALQKAYLISTPMAEDVVGFGRHSALEYQNINLYHQDYREWVLRTDAEETGCDYRLRRLAQWLRANPVDKTEKEIRVKPKAAHQPKEKY
ncbi:unnamed protein product, partial [Symbiodinium necroappetens]